MPAARAIQMLTFAVATVSVFLAGAAFAATTGYDGTYQGDVTLTRGDPSLCGKSPFHAVKQVVNGHFDLLYDIPHHVGVNLDVQLDGSFSGSQQYLVAGGNSRQSRVTASGRISGNVLTAHVEGDACARDYHLTKN